MRLKSNLPAALKYHAVVIESAAREARLDFFDVVFELLDAKDVNGVAAYGGFPVRFPSWRFGMEYERLEKGRRWGLSKIYELVINNDPTYAYLVRSNSLLEQKLVMAHVYGHADFFKNNLWFAPTDRHMLDTMGLHSTRVRRYIDALGQETVERFTDRVLSLDSMIDPYLPLRALSAKAAPPRKQTPMSERALRSLEAVSATPFSETDDEDDTAPRMSGLPTYDILGFIEEHAELDPWQRDVLRIARREAYYFAPQRMTKIMNEGWASYWHSKLLTGGILEPSEILDFADCHSGATACPPGQANPYKIGIELIRHAEALGEDIFQLRRVHNDVSLVHKLVDEDFAVRFLAPVYLPRMRGRDGEVPPDVTWGDLKTKLLQELSWGGLPQIELVDVDSEGEGELLLVHHHDGRDLQLGRASETLKNLEQLWHAPVHLLTIEEKQGRRLVCRDGEVSVLDTREAEKACAGEGAGESAA
ncbi:MAG: SpoVR family protein [Planctomycetota bacterium]